MSKKDAIIVNDEHKLIDRVTCNYKNDSAKPRRGFVSIIDKDSGDFLVKDKPCEFGGTGKSNMIVYAGRTVVPQVLFDKDRVLNSGERNLRIRYLSVGSGGASASNPLDPLTPDPEETGLTVEEYIYNDQSDLEALSSYADGGKKKPIGTVEFQNDPENTPENPHPLIAKAITEIDYGEAVGVDISELGLWMGNSEVPGDADQFMLFSKVNISTIRKGEDRALIVIWYIYF